MGQGGAHKIVLGGFTNIAKGNVFGDFEDWVDASLSPELVSKTNHTVASSVEAQISTQARASSLRYDVNRARQNGQETDSSRRARQGSFGGPAALRDFEL